MSMGERIKTLRKENGLTQAKLAGHIGVEANTISRWENDKIEASHVYVVKLANVLGTTADYLLGRLGETDTPVPPQTSPIAPGPGHNIRRLPDDVIELPVYSITACMGSGFDNEDEQWAQVGTSYLSVNDVGVAYPERPYIILADGDSMEPKISAGEKLVVNPNIQPGRGDICLARFRDGGWMRDAIKYYYPHPDGGITLKASETSGVPPMNFTSEETQSGDVIIVGRIMYIDRGERA